MNTTPARTDTLDQFETPEQRQARWETAANAAGREVDRNALRAYMAVADAEQQHLADQWAHSVAASDIEIRRLRAELERRTEDAAFLERTTLPELRRQIEHHKAGKQRWRDRAEKAETRVRELERPDVEAARNEIRQSFAELIAQAREDRDYEGAFNVQCQLRDREEQWKREDAAA